MIKISKIPDDCFLLDSSKFDKIGVRDGRITYKNKKGNRIYQWDHTKNHVEEYDGWGYHLRVLDTVAGNEISGPVPGRRIYNI